jgi:hypothetical protein
MSVNIDPIPVIAAQEERAPINKYPQVSTVQRGLLVATLVCGILSLVPPLRFGASLALRSVSLLTSLTACADKEAPQDALSCFTRTVRIGVVVLGIAGVAAVSPLLVTVSLIVDVVMQALECVRALEQGDNVKAFVHFSAVVIDVFVLAALITGAWQLMVAAAGLTVLMMMVLTMYAMARSQEDNGRVFEATLYFLLTAFSIATIIAISEIPKAPVRKAHFFYINKEDNPVTFKDQKGNILAVVQPGKRMELDVTARNVRAGAGIGTNTTYHMMMEGEGWCGDLGSIAAYDILPPPIPALPASQFHTVPVGSVFKGMVSRIEGVLS